MQPSNSQHFNTNTTQPFQSTSSNKEINLKNQQWSELKTRITSLLNANQTWRSTIETWKSRHYQTPATSAINAEQSEYRPTKKELEYWAIINNWQRENREWKQRLNTEQRIEKDWTSTLSSRIWAAQSEIENLSVMNTIKDNIWNKMQSFYIKINNIWGIERRVVLNYEEGNIDDYINSLEEIEDRVYQQLKYERFNYGKQGEREGRAWLMKGMQINKLQDNIGNCTDMVRKTYRGYYPTPMLKNCEEVESVCNRGLSARTRRKQSTFRMHNKYCERLISPNKEGRNQVMFSPVSRTPPREWYEYISPSSEKGRYLDTVNNSLYRSRMVSEDY